MILHVISSLETGGAETALTRLVTDDMLVDRHVVVNLGKGGTRAELLRQQQIQLIELDASASLGGCLSLMLGLLSVRVRLQPNVIVGWMPHGMLAAFMLRCFYWRPLTMLWAVRADVKSIAVGQDALRDVVAKFCGIISSAPCAITFNSHTSCDNHTTWGGFPKRKSVIIPNGFDVDGLLASFGARDFGRARLGISSTSPVIAIAARFHPDKDFPIFVQALQLCIKQHPTVVGILAGRGLTADNVVLTEWFRDISPENYRLIGDVSNIADFYAMADVATLTSQTESFPNAIGEAMACGLPCVATDAGDCRLLIGATGVIVSIKDAEGLATAWSELLADETRRRHLGEMARGRIRDHFSLTSFVSAYSKLFSSMSGNASCVD